MSNNRFKENVRKSGLDVSENRVCLFESVKSETEGIQAARDHAHRSETRGARAMQLRNEFTNRRSSRGQWKSDIELQLIEGVGKGI
jgi:hypothetical protein